MKRKFTLLIAALALLTMIVQPGRAWGQMRSDFEFNLNQLYQNGSLVTAKTVIETTGGSLTFTDQDENFTILLTRNSGNQPGFYTSSGYIRFYSGDTFKLSAADGITMTKIVITPNGSSFNLSSMTGLNTSTKTWEGSASEVTFTGSGTNKWDKLTITYTSGGSTTTPTTVTIDATGITNTDVYTSTAAGSLSATVTENTNNTPISGATVTWASSNTDAATIDDSGAVTLVAAGTTTITASYAGNSTYSSSSATYDLVVVDNTPSSDQWVLTNLADLTADDVFVIVGNNGSNYAMKNTSASNSGPVVVAVTVSGTELTGTIGNDIKWNISGDASNGYIFYPNGSSSTWLYCINNNNGLRIGSGNTDYNTFKIHDNYIYNIGRERYVGIYSNTDWRSYTSINNNISGQTFAFYKKVNGGTVTPSITAANVDLVYNATNGSIAYTINNEPDPAGTLTAAVTDGDWLTLGQGTTSPIAFTCTANENITARTATVTLTYTYNTNETVTKDVTVTQAAAPVSYTTIPDLFAAATSTETPVYVTFNNWVVSGVSTNGKNVFVTDGTNGFVIFDNGGNLGDTYHVNDHITGTTTASLVLYTGFAELKNVNTTNLTMTSGEAPAFSDVAMADLAGVNTGALVQYNNLTCSVSNNKYYLSDGTTTIQVYNALYAFEALEDGETYNITGVYQQFNNTKEVLPRSADDIVEVVAPITPTLATENVNIASNITGGTITYTLENPTQDGVLTAAVTAGNEGNWLTLGTVGANVPFTCTENAATTARTATVTLTYTYNTSETITATAVVTQAAPIVPPTPGSWVLTNLADLTSSDIFVIVGTDSDEDTYALPNNGTSAAPTVATITIVNGALSTEPAAELQWNISGNATDGYTFYPNGSTNTWLYCNTTAASGSNNNIRVGTGDRKVFELDSNGYLVTNDDNVDRYLSIYINSGTAQDWRGYINSNSAPTIAFYKKVNSTDPSITITPAAITEVPCYGGGGLLEVTYANMGDTPNPQIIKCDSDGNPATYDWLTAEFENGTANIRGTISANNSNADRTAYLKVCGTAVNSETVCSNIVSITQLAYPTITTATLPFAFDGDNEELATTAGLAQAGLGSSYGDSPKLKFKETGSFVILHFNEAPNTLTFDIKGDGFDGTFKVQTSADNVTYTDLKEYTSSNLTDNLVSESFNTLNANVRYIKWVYTAATSGKVRLGNIGLTNFSPSITLNTYAISVDANQHDGTLDATYEFIDFTNDPEVVWFESDGVTPAANDPDWVVAIINTDKDFDYTIDENNDAASRTAYFKVYALAETSGNDVYSDLVTVTQEGLVVDYATLPFVWEGGSSADLKALTGVTTSTLSADYAASHAPYLIKFDNDGKYIQVKTDSQPAKVTIGVKMIGGANTSYITVMASTDGNTFDDGEQLAISGNSGSIVNLETTRTFASDVRYVKMVFTKGSNVGVGPITITKYTTDPIINADDVDLAYDATSGEIPYTITNPVTSVSLAATTTADWISNITVNDEKVSFTTTQNESTTARTATFTLTYTGATDKTVTVTQGAIDYATIPFAFDGGKADIENTRGLTENGLDSDYSSSPKLKFNTTGDWVVLKLNAAPISLSYDIKGNSFSGGTFTVQTSEDGEDYEDLATYTELGDVQSITHINLATTVRYIKWVYTEKSNGNVALGNIHASNEYDTYGDVTIDSDALATHSVTVHSGSVVTFVGTNTNADKLVIEDGGQLIVSNSGVQATFKKSVSHSAAKDANNWYTISSPVNNITPSAVTNLIQTPADNYDLYYYDEENVMWKNHKKAAITNLTNGKGYLYWNAGGDELSFPGELNSGNIEIALTKTGTGDLAGWNLIGNPYSHNIYKGAGTAIVNSVSEGYELTTGFYTLANSGAWVAGTDNTTAIVPGQGILVKATTAGTLTMTNTNSKGSAKANTDNIQFVVSNSEYQDVAYAWFNTGIGLDKINHRNADIPMVYIPQNGQNYAIATMDDNTQAFELNFKAMTTGQYTLSYKAEGKYSYLHVIDRLTGEDIDMLLDGEYSFIGSPRDNEARFIVKLSYNANIDEIEVNDIFAYQNGSDIIVNGNGELQVFDVTGRMVMNTKINGIQTVNVPATGMYIFRMVGESVQTQKIVVR